MIEFIKNYFINITVVDGGLRLDLSYATLILVTIFVWWQVKRLVTRLAQFLDHLADFFRGDKKDAPRATIH